MGIVSPIGNQITDFFNSLQSGINGVKKITLFDTIDHSVHIAAECSIDLEKYFDKVISSEVYLKLENTSDKENKTVEVKVHVPGEEFLVKKTCKTFEEAVDLDVTDTEAYVAKANALAEKYNMEIAGPPLEV